MRTLIATFTLAGAFALNPAHAALQIDFSDSAAEVAAGYAGFVFTNNTAPGTRTYELGDAGYTGTQIDLGLGVGVTLENPSTPGQAFRLIDRGGTDLFLRDYAGMDGSLNKAQDLVFAGLTPGQYTVTVSLDDIQNQHGIADVQVSNDGGATFTNVLDNVVYGNTGNQAAVTINPITTEGSIVRFWVGGNQFGTTGGTTDSVSRNRIFTINGLSISGNPVETGLLKVDFNASNAFLADGYAPFTFADNTTPGTRTYTNATTGYTGTVLDNGGGVTVTLEDAANPSAVFRMVDRGGTDLFLRDYTGRDSSFNLATDLSFGNLTRGAFRLSVSLDDISNQFGVADVQLSTDGGLSFVNLLDNVVYGNTGNAAELLFDANGTDDVIVRFWVGGNQFGTTGGTTDNAQRNRIFTINGFELFGAPVPAPATVPAGLALLAIAAARRR